MNGVLIRSANYLDPRFSQPQIRALEAAAKADPGAVLLGLDFSMRPVIRARLGLPPADRTYAVQRNGDPTEPRASDFSETNFVKEPWGGTS